MVNKDNYILRVTAGPTRDPASHSVVSVNSANPIQIQSPRCTVDLCVRIQDYHGLPRNSPSTSSYFSTQQHEHDMYSISFRLRLHSSSLSTSSDNKDNDTSDGSIPATALLWGNDFDKPVRDRLPPGFGTAFRIVKWGIDPGIDGDMYADEPYLYGCALSSFNVISVGDQVSPEDKKPAGGGEESKEGDEAMQEGGTSPDSLAWREERGVPDAADARKKWALNAAHQEKWTWEAGREYGFDFFNPYLDFNNFALKLPGFSLSLLGYLGGEDFLRYVLTDKRSGEVLFAVVFHLLDKGVVEKEEAEAKEREKETQGDEVEWKEGDEGKETKDFQPKDDDVD